MGALTHFPAGSVAVLLTNHLAPLALWQAGAGMSALVMWVHFSCLGMILGCPTKALQADDTLENTFFSEKKLYVYIQY